MYKFVSLSAVILLLLGFSTLSAATITVELKDGSGAPITSGATLRYHDGAWKTDATNNGDGTWTINTSITSAASLYYEMTYNYGVQQIGPISAATTTITFRTTTTTVRLEKADHTGLAGGAARYTQGGTWHDIGITTAGNAPVVELLPVSYHFGMTYNYGYQQFSPLTIPGGGGSYTVTFTTTATTVRLETSAHVGLDGGVARYTPAGAWHNIGATSGGDAPVVDLLPGSYYFDMDYNHGHQQLTPRAVSGASQTIVFTTTATTVRLETSLHAGLDGGAARYNQGAWWDIGTTTGGNAPVIQLLPGSYFFDMAFNNGKQQKDNVAVSGAAQTVTFQTTKVTVRLENCSHTGFAGGVARYNQDTWNPLPNTDTNGNTSIELLPGSYYFDMDYHFGHQQVGPLAVAGNSQTVLFQTTSVSLEGSGAKEYNQGAWHPFTNPIDLLPGSYYFRSGGVQVGPYNVSGCTFYRAFVTVELRNGAGGFITSGATLRYHDGSWKTDAIDNHNGTFSVIATAPSVYYEMTYNYGKQQTGPFPATTSPVTFQTTTTTVRLENSAHTGLAGGIARFNQAAWNSFGTTGASGDAPPMELLPGSYYFDMDFNHGHQQLGPLAISGDVPHTQTVLFQTTTTKVQLLSGGGGGLSGGVAGYNQNAWHNFGTTDGTGLTGVQELLPGSYHFDMVYNNGRQQIGPTNVAGNDQTITFTTTTTTVRLVSGGGGGGLPGGVARFNQGTWQPAGTTGADGNISPGLELLPGSYYFDMVYNNGRQQLGPMNVTGLTQTVTFTTTTTTVRLENCDHTGFPDGVARYHQGTWNSFGTTEASGNTPAVELLPGSYYFDMNYNYGGQQLGPLAVAGNTQTVLFQTTTVTISGTGTTEYHQGAWHTFNSPIELLPGDYYFREDGNQVGPLSVPGCSFSGSFVKGKGTLAAQYGSPTVDIDADVSAGEPAGGTFRITYATGTGHLRAGVTVSGEIVCMRVGNNIVYLAGLVTESNSSEWIVGQYVRFGIQDASPDNLNYTVGENTVPDCNTFTQTAELPLVAGGYTILNLGGGSLPTAPSVSAGADKEIGSGQTTAIGGDPTATGGTTPYTFSWAPATGLDDPNTANPNASPIVTTTYTVTVTDANHQTATDQVTVTVNPLPIANAGPDQAICYGQTVKLGGNPTASGGSGSYTYSWEPPTGLLDPATDANPRARPLNTMTYKVTVTDAKGCQAMDQVTITVHNFVFLSNSLVKINQTQDSNGDIHANGKIEFGKGAPGVHVGNLEAVDDVKIEDKNTIQGNATAGDELYLFGKAKVTGTKTEHAAVATIPLPSLSYSAGGPNVKVAANASKTLTPGSYGEVEVKTKAMLLLSAGDYYMTTLDTDENAILSINASAGPVNIYVVSDLEFDNNVQVKLTGGTSDNVLFASLQKHKIDMGVNVTIYGTLINPNAEIHFSNNCKIKGAVFAESITLDPKVKFYHHTSPGTFPKESAVEEAEVASGQSPVTSYQLAQNYPNPFSQIPRFAGNPSTTIQFSVPEAGVVQLSVYNITGQEVRTLVSGQMNAGRHMTNWDGKDNTGQVMPSGVYLYKLRVNGFVQTRKMTFMK